VESDKSNRWKQLIYVHRELDELGLSPNEFRVYAHLARHTTSQNLKAFPGLRKMAAICRMNKDTVSKALHRLQELHLIEITAERRGTATVYVIPTRAAWRIACALFSDSPISEVSGSDRATVPIEAPITNSMEVEKGSRQRKSTTSLDELTSYAQSRERPASDGAFIFEKLEARGWMIAGSRIRDAFAFFREWESASRLPSQDLGKNPPIRKNTYGVG
jgi:DNA-binding MarR family transcriptional regulator